MGRRSSFGRREIVAQFALEAGLLCGAGGLAGLPLGFAFCAIVAWMAGWAVSISPIAIATSLALSCVVGLTFGIYPARLAARLDPAVALRQD